MFGYLVRWKNKSLSHPKKRADKHNSLRLL